MQMKTLLTGNEAIAQGAWEAGVMYASAYPGTPSTEILENIAEFKEDIIAEWAPNEKVALEAAIGVSVIGGRTLSLMQARGMAGHRRDHPHALTSGLGAWRPEPSGLLARFYRSPRASGNGPARRLHTTCSYHHPWNPGMAARMRCLAPIRRHDR